MGIDEDELEDIKNKWRATSPRITKLWWDIDRCRKEAVIYKRHTSTHGIKFDVIKNVLFVTLPSGRKLSYCKPKITLNSFGSDCIGFYGVDQTTKQWGLVRTYGPKLVENIVQGIARDCLRDAIERVSAAGYKVVMHVHDEIIVDAEKDKTLDELVKLMCVIPTWAKGLPLNADGYECEFYMKD